MDNEVSKAASALGKKGRAANSEAQAAASKANGKKGGRPKAVTALHNVGLAVVDAMDEASGNALPAEIHDTLVTLTESQESTIKGIEEELKKLI